MPDLKIECDPKYHKLNTLKNELQLGMSEQHIQ